MNRYLQYKHIELPWLSEIPAHWDIVRNKNVFSEIKDTVGEDSASYTLLSLTLKGIIPRDLESGKGKFPKDFDTYKIVKKGNMAFCLFDIDETPRTVGLSEYDGMLTGAYTILQVRKVNPRFSYYYYLALDNIKALRPLYSGLRKTINVGTFLGTKFPLPPRDEQDRIVRFLDWKVSEINKLINIKRKEIGILDNGIAIKLKSELSKLPDAKDVPLKRILLVPITDGPHQTPEFADSGIPFVSAEASHDGRIHLNECRGFITREQHELFCKKVRPQRNDIFIVKSGSTTGKTVIVDFDDEFSIWSPLALVRCNQLAVPQYIFYYCSSIMFQQQVRDNWSFGTQPNIGMSVLKDLRILLPSVEEQKVIVEKLDDYWKKTLNLKENIEMQIGQLQDFQNRLIFDTVTGKIDVRGIKIPEYEYVEEEADEDEEDITGDMEGNQDEE